MLEKVYPNWRTIVGVQGSKGDYRLWLSKQDDAYQSLLNTTNSAAVIANSIERFKADTAKSASPTTTLARPQKAEPRPVEIGRVASVNTQYGYFVVAINNSRFGNSKDVIVFSGNDRLQGTVEKRVANNISVTPNNPQELDRIKVGDGAFSFQ